MTRSKRGGPAAAEDRRFATAHYERFINHVRTPLQLKLSMSYRLLISGTPERSITLRCVEFLEELWSSKQDVDATQAMRILNAFLILRGETTWEISAKRLLAARLAMFEAKRESGFFPSSSAFEITAILEVALVAKDSAMATRVLEELRLPEPNVILPLTVLVRYGDHANARALLRQGRDTMRATMVGVAEWTIWYLWIDGESESFRFDSILEAQLPGFVEAVDTPSEKLIGELLIASACDTENDAIRPSRTRKERLNALATRFIEADYLVGSAKELCVAFLASERSNLPVIEEALEEAASKLSIRSVVTNDFKSLGSRQVQLSMAYLYRALCRGESSAFVSAVEELRAKAFNTEKTLVDLSRLVISMANVQLPQWSPRWCEAVIPAFRAILETKSLPAHAHRYPAAFLALFHVLAGSEAELEEWLQRNQHAAAGKEYAFGGLIRLALVKKREPLEDAKRVELALRAYANPHVMRPSATDQNLFRKLVRSEILDADELREHGATLAKKFPRNGHAWRELSALELAAGNSDRALEYLAHALGTTAANERDVASWNLAKARILVDTKRLHEAARTLSEIRIELLDGSERTEFSELLAELPSQE